MSAAARPANARLAALDPAVSVWVAASAGTGKTRVLTERLLRLLLDGSDPAHILCLTFTRAAAAEMANRVNERLALWTTLPPGALAEDLQQLTGRNAQEDESACARQLFARVLDTPGGIKIQTIHAFCQSLLRRFPLEAGVAPEFAVIDERGEREALAEAAASVIAAARGGGDRGEQPVAALARALAVVAHYAPEERFAELMSGLAGERGKLRAALAEGEAALAARLGAALGVPPDATPENLADAFCSDGPADAAGLAAAARGSAAPRAAIIAGWCASVERRRELLDDYLRAFLTKGREIRKRYAADNAPAALGAEAARAKTFVDRRSAAALLVATAALIRLGGALVDAYERRKRLQGLLDFDDLVDMARALLRRPGIAPWVLFKLDGGVDHILIDEAQDTNPEQWDIVKALAEEFFAGEGAREGVRTVFAVGDAKQSIYSFQRADPHAFGEMRQHFEERVNAAQQCWKVVPLDISFRAAAPLLTAVDAVFERDAAADGVRLDGRAIRHVAARAGHAGLVELWPSVRPLPEAAPDPLSPAPARRVASPRTRLARAIAAQIAHWLAAGELLEARGRPLRPGDIMVLVRRRDTFVGDLLRALKKRGVPVAGADRLMLSEELAVEDLVALGRFLLMPEDDLTLATVLKGPLCEISEDELFLIAHGRGEEPLWRRVRRFAPEHPAIGRAERLLSALLARADFVPPFELYAEILGARGGRRAMLERLGPDAADPIEEFLMLALAYERQHVPSLQGFLHWLAAGDIEIKRDFGERQRDELRILTVHGAKGLEAPVVFLPDTMQLPDRNVKLLWTAAGALPLWRPRADLSVPLYADEQEALRRRQLEEYRRLLYVALTRAQDRLYVSGWETQRQPTEAPTWYDHCRAGWDGLAAPFAFDARALIGSEDGWSGAGLRLAAPHAAALVREKPAATRRHAGPPPRWLGTPPPPEPDPPKPLFPSRPSGGEPATLSPLAVAGRDRFKRGLLVHRLLQSLPELPAGEREAAARRFLALPVHAIAAAEQEEICRETLKVLDDPRFALLWGPDAQAEVPVIGLIGGRALSGQIDRLVVTRDRVLIVDYKSLRPPPANEDGVPALYLQQLATYRAALARIYPDRAIECALLWTEGPRLMPIGADRLARPAGLP